MNYLLSVGYDKTRTLLILLVLLLLFVDDPDPLYLNSFAIMEPPQMFVLAFTPHHNRRCCCCHHVFDSFDMKHDHIIVATTTAA